ncbi:MAG: ATP-binding cassette domain-containing protein [Rhizobiales bacterium]|nr:ATP-binding cassette domain-containing protein [Hyphomicrobiales bacterium]NRB14783.1 ATP-binding cassette domain-containing protein [Hyphomicrobiales bacterium]
MESLIKVSNLSKSFKNIQVLKNVSFEIEKGHIYGLIGHNGAGKTTILNCILGLMDYDGEISVLGKSPYQERFKLMQDIAFISDVASLPRFLKVKQLIELMKDIHPKFSEDKINEFLQNSNIKLQAKVKSLSKGMLAQLHLAIVMSIDAKILVLDEPTLGLDIINRKNFFKQLIDDYMHDGRTILVTTHQIDEIEFLLSDIMFVRDGELILNCPMEEVADRYTQLILSPDSLEAAQALKPIYEDKQFGQTIMLFDNVKLDEITKLGTVSTPNISDLFVALMQK